MRSLGIDGGGSGLKSVVITEHGVITELPPGPPVNGIMDRDLAERISALVRHTGAETVGLGIAGVRDDRAAATLAATIESTTGVRPVVADDALAALWGAFGDHPGAIVIAGTGSAALARDHTGTLIRLGGHGFLVGDEGSGYWIGREIIRLVLRSLSGLDTPRPQLTQIVQQEYGTTIHDIEHAIYHNPSDRARLASLARHASELPADPIVDSLFTAAAEELLTLARGVTRKAGTVPISMVGGLWEIPLIRTTFLRCQSATTPTESPSVGAARWALNAATSARR